MKKVISILLAMAMILAILPAAFAVGYESVDAEVAGIEKYGNLDLNVKASDFQSNGYKFGDVVTVRMNDSEFEMPVGSNYSDVDQGQMICRVVIDETKGKDYVVLAINMGNLAEKAGIATKTKIEEDPGYRWDYNEGVEQPVKVTISMKEPGGYYDQWLIHQLKRTDAREDYPQLSDAEFANFREVQTTGMGAGRLYRSSSPVNPELKRNTYADTAMKEAGVRTVMNLADNREGMEAYPGYKESYYATANVIPLNLGVDFSAQEFKQGLKAGFEYLAANEGPYLVHCNEGKDRAGFTAAILECLMGATAEEVVADYMVTYYNYYNVEAGSDQYKAVADSNIKKSLAAAFGVEDIMAEGVDLQAEAVAYLKEDLGMAEEKITALRANLTEVSAEVAGIEKYGNLDLNIKGSDFLALGFEFGDVVTVKMNGKELEMPVGSNYSDVDQGQMICRVVVDEAKEKDYVVLAINMGNLAEKAGIATKTKIEEDPGYRWDYNDGVEQPVKVTITMKKADGYHDEWLIHQLKRTDDRDDYKNLTDAEFANFREVRTDGMGAYALFRTSSPVNPELNRNTYADAAMKRAGVKTVMNLADNKEGMEAYPGYADTYYSTANIIPLNLGVDFSAPEFKQGLKAGFEFLAANEGPYLVHCNEGKDRAGFTAAILECLMGADRNQVVEDYMVTYYNYYDVEPGTEQYEAVANSNIKKSLAAAFGVEDIMDGNVNLRAEAEEYLLNDLGMEQEKIDALKENLSRDYYNENRFIDVKMDDWFFYYVMKMEHEGVFNGMSEDEFRPDIFLTRGQLAVMLYRLAGEPEVEELSTFTDVDEHQYYAKAIAWAQDENIVNGMENNTYCPESCVSREQLVTMLYRASEDRTKKNNAPRFKDADKISDWAEDAFKWAIDLDIIQGGTIEGQEGLWLNPGGNTLRAEAAKIFCVWIHPATAE